MAEGQRRTIVGEDNNSNQQPLLTLQETPILEHQSLTFSPKKLKVSPLSPNPPTCLILQATDELVNLQPIENLGCEIPKKRFELASEENNERLEIFLQNLVKSRFECSRSMKVEVVDETALIDVFTMRKKDKTRARKANSNPNHTRKIVYSRKEIEGFRFINLEGQNKFWQQIYYCFGEIVKRDYDQLVNLRQQGRIHPNSGVQTDYVTGILGVGAAMSKWNHRNLRYIEDRG